MGKWRSGEDNIPTLDLHGFKVDQVFDALERFLRQEEAKNSAKVRILHGKGTGKVREEVLRYLKTAHYPSKAEQDSRGKSNEGSLLIFLD